VNRSTSSVTPASPVATVSSAAKGVPTHEGLAAFGEIGLTGRLRPAAQTERRLEECAKLGISTVITPAETETLPKAIAAALG